jgi:hypothetical protein
MNQAPAAVTAYPRPPLNEGEIYIGAIISADGSRNHHIILLPGELKAATWEHAMTWADENGGELPDRVEGALLFATMKDEFQPEWYWTRDTRASTSDYAWMQGFISGSQNGYGNRQGYSFRARAVRRLAI